MTGLHPRPRKGRVVDVPEFGNPVQREFSRLRWHVTLSQCLGQFVSGPRTVTEQSQDDLFADFDGVSVSLRGPVKLVAPVRAVPCFART